MPSLTSMENPTEGYSYVAKGSAGVAEVVQTMRHYPQMIVEDVEARVRQECGAIHPGDTWSVEKHA